MIASRTRSNDCLSDLRLDQLVAAELAADDAAVARRHLEGCAACATRQHVLAHDRAAFRAGLPPRTFVADAIAARAARPTRRWWRITMPALAAAAAIVAVVVLRAPQRERAGEATRAKGGDHLGFYIERDGVALPGADGDIVHPGERVRFTVTIHAPAHVAIGSIDDAGRAFVYYPASADLGLWAAAGERALPDAIELDVSLGRERVFAWFCDRALDAASVRAALAAPDHALTGCRSDSLTWDKQVR